MKYLLDSDILIYFLKGQSQVVDAFSQVSEEDLAISIISHSELLYGAFYSQNQDKNLKKIEQIFKYLPILAYDEKSSHIFAELKAQLRKNGMMLMDFDLMIASIALQRDLILVTNNQKHFERIPGIKLENWSH